MAAHNHRDRLLQALGADPRLSREAISAIAAVPRERFVDPRDSAQAYADAALQVGPDATISAPSMVAEMLSVLGLRAGTRVLEIGSGTGYAAACMAAAGADVTGIEILDELAERSRRNLDQSGFGVRVTIIAADGSGGFQAGAPYDRIVASAAIDAVPAAWLEQVAAGGAVVYPEAGPDYDLLVRLSRDGEGWRREEMGLCRFVRMRLGYSSPM